MKISRKYDVLTKFLRDTILTAKSERVRLQAAERLDGIYARHERYEQQALQRRHRADIKALTMQEQEGAVPAQEGPSEEEVKAAQERADLADFDRMMAENRASRLARADGAAA